MLTDKIKSWTQLILPTHALSRIAGAIACSERPAIRNWTINHFMAHYHPDLSDAIESNPLNYNSFNQFFTRELKPNARTWTTYEDHLSCPIDGYVSQIGQIKDETIVQAKGRNYSVTKLLRDKTLAESFQSGSFATLYLSPTDYHRIHMPIEGRLISMRYVPGRLFAVNPAATRSLRALFTRNERVICHFETENGPLVIVMVGAMLVGGISTPWQGHVCPGSSSGRHKHFWDYSHEDYTFQRGDEIGCFHFGSTVILLSQAPLHWADSLSER